MNVNDATKAFRQQLLQADPLRARGLDALAQIRRGRAAGLEREHKRLIEVYGKDDPRVLATERRLASDRALVVQVTREAERAKAVVLEVGEGRWVLHGHVLCADLAGVPDVTISLHDADGRWIEQLGRACSDERGYFRLEAQVVNAESEEAARVTTVRLRAHDVESTLLQASDQPITVREGAAEYVEVRLGEKPRECPPPPSGTRKQPRRSPKGRGSSSSG